MGTTKEDIASRAFVLIGADPVTDFTSGDSIEADTAQLLYEAIVEAELGSYEWNFAKSQVQLSKDAADPIGAQWSAQFNRDVVAITVRGVHVEGRPINYEIQGTKILCDATEDDVVIMKYIGRPSESQWPAYFDMTMIYKLASDFAGSLARDGDLITSMDNKFIFQLRRAKAMDTQAETSKRLRTRRLISVRK